jgi:DNA-binding NtrC family response regulator
MSVVKQKILAVDDEVESLNLLHTQLQDMGHDVILASSGDEALILFNKLDDITMLITDIIMPRGITGYQLATVITAIDPSIKVILTTEYTIGALTNAGKIVSGMLLNTIAKPHSYDELESAIRAAIW